MYLYLFFFIFRIESIERTYTETNSFLFAIRKEDGFLWHVGINRVAQPLIIPIIFTWFTRWYSGIIAPLSIRRRRVSLASWKKKRVTDSVFINFSLCRNKVSYREVASSFGSFAKNQIDRCVNREKKLLRYLQYLFSFHPKIPSFIINPRVIRIGPSIHSSNSFLFPLGRLIDALSCERRDSLVPGEEPRFVPVSRGEKGFSLRIIQRIANRPGFLPGKKTVMNL